MKKFVYILIFLILLQGCSSTKVKYPLDKKIKQKIIYVNVNSKGADNGKSWENAYKSLADAIAFSNEEEQIWVAQGVYYPTDSADRRASFILKKNTAIYGGFTGDETELAQRDFIKNKTILSGDIGKKNFDADNSYHVVIGNDNTVLDGFIIEKGYAVPEESLTDSEKSNEYYSNGAGIYNNNVALLIKNCTLRDNHAENEGGGVYNTGWGKESPIIYNTVKFINNSSNNNGGAVSNNSIKKLFIINSIFLNNSSVNSGGGIFNGEGSFQILDNILMENNSSKIGGAITLDVNSGTILSNSTIKKNISNLTASAIFQRKGLKNYLEIVDSIVEKNECEIDSREIFNWEESIINIENSKIPSKFLKAKNDGIGYRDELKDYLKNVKSYNQNIEKINLNNFPKNINYKKSFFFKDKIDKTLNKIYVVADGKKGKWDGKSWNTAFRSLQKAIDFAYLSKVKEIWVAQGIYRPSKKNRDESFYLRDNIKLYGGFRGNETKISSRNPELYKTILSGNIGEHNSKNDNSFHVVTGDGNIYIDGFIIGWAYNDNKEINSKGGGLISFSKTGDKIIIKNTIFENSYAEYGGGLYAYGDGNLYFENTEFISNSAGYGGAVADRTQGDSSFKETVFAENISSEKGGALYSDIDKIYNFSNVDFRENYSKGYGGALYLINFNNETKSSKIEDSILSDNESKVSGGVIFLVGDIKLLVKDTYFFNNKSKIKSEYIKTSLNSEIKLEKCEFENNF